MGVKSTGAYLVCFYHWRGDRPNSYYVHLCRVATMEPENVNPELIVFQFMNYIRQKSHV